MTDRPILFSAPMIKALLAGTKTQTRRLMKQQPPADSGPLTCGEYHPTKVDRSGEEFPGPLAFGASSEDGSFATPIRIRPSDRLWVRESIDKVTEKGDAEIGYKADWPGDGRGLGWRPSIHMPRWASRLTLTVTDVRVQRLQDISEEDAIAEGAYVGKASGRVADNQMTMNLGMWFASGRAWYADLWDRINGEGAWARNDWVVAYSFSVERRNIDAEG